MPTKVIAASFALIAFALAIALGVVAGNTAATTIWRGLVAMIVCYFLGQLIGYAGRRAMTEHVDRYKREHPIPELDLLVERGEPVEDAAGQKSQDAASEAERPTTGQAA